MIKHTFFIRPLPNALGVFIGCSECKDPEPPVTSYVWQDQDSTVYFDGQDANELVLFMAQHDAFNLVAPDAYLSKPANHV